MTRTEAVLDRASIERLISECKEDLETLNSVTPCCDCDRKPAGAVCAWTTKLQLMKAATSRSKENQPIIVLALTQLLSEIDFLEKAPVGCPVHANAGDIVDQMIHHVPELARVRDSLITDVMNEKWHHVARTIADVAMSKYPFSK